MSKSITFVGLDVHKNSIAVALADDGRNAEVRNYGIIGGSLDDLDRLVKKSWSQRAKIFILCMKRVPVVTMYSVL